MLVELTGPSGAGKSTWLASVLDGASPSGEASVVYRDDVILGRLRLSRLSGRLARLLVLDGVTALSVLRCWSRDRSLRSVILRSARKPPTVVARFERLNVVRNAFKNVYLGELAGKWAKPHDIVLLDEGPVHIAHYLFVHESIDPDVAVLLELTRVVRLPDAVVLLHRSMEDLEETMSSRGHRRVSAEPLAHRHFLQKSADVLDLLVESLVDTGRLKEAEQWTCGGQIRTLYLTEDQIAARTPDKQQRLLALISC